MGEPTTELDSAGEVEALAGRRGARTREGVCDCDGNCVDGEGEVHGRREALGLGVEGAGGASSSSSSGVLISAPPSSPSSCC